MRSGHAVLLSLALVLGSLSAVGGAAGSSFGTFGPFLADGAASGAGAPEDRPDDRLRTGARGGVVLSSGAGPAAEPAGNAGAIDDPAPGPIGDRAADPSPSSPRHDLPATVGGGPVPAAVEGGAIPVGATSVGTDADGDGLPNGEESLRGTDPSRPDTDGDGLRDGREVDLGTDPTAADTDGDRLLDGWEVRNGTGEVALPGADPRRMDLYVQVNYGAGIEPLADADERAIRDAFARMPVSNPDGSTGIALHLDDSPPHGGQLLASIPVDDAGDQPRLAAEYYSREHLGARAGIYHLLLVVEIDDRMDVAGLGDAPGYFAVIDGDRVDHGTGAIPLRDRAVVHELLHNVFGRIPDADGSRSYLPALGPTDDYHTEEGWLSADPRRLDEHEFLPDRLGARLAEDGFADPEWRDGVTTG